MKFTAGGTVLRSALVLTVAGGLCGTLTGATFADAAPHAAAPRAAATPDHGQGRCEQPLQGWTEQTMQYFSTGTPVPPAREVGDALIYNDYIFDASNNQVGHAVGYVSVIGTLANGDLDSYYHATYDLPDGDLNAVGNIDRTAMFAGKPVVFHVTGTTGAYAGKHGTIVWQLQSVPATLSTRVTLDAKLCG